MLLRNPMPSGVQPDRTSQVGLSPQEFAARSGLSLSTVHRYLKNGRLKKWQPGGGNCCVFIPVSELFRCAEPGGLCIDSDTPTRDDSEAITATSSYKLAGPAPKWIRRFEIQQQDLRGNNCHDNARSNRFDACLSSGD